MKLKELVFMSLLVGIGFILHTVVPGFFFGMKPDMLLTMMFLGIFLFPKIRNVIILALTTGFISALTTSFPGGQIPNIIDKCVTSIVVFVLLILIGKFFKKSIIDVSILTFIGTIVSGTTFLISALIIVGLPAPFISLFCTIVIPTSIINTIMVIIVYPVIINIKNKFRF